MSESTATKSNVFKEEMALATGGTGAAETGVRRTSTGGEVTLTKVDAFHLQFRSVDGSVDDLVDGGNDIDVGVNDLDVSGNLTLTAETTAGYLKNTAAGVVSGGNSIPAADLPSAIDASKIANGSVSNAEFQYLANVTSDIQTQIDAAVSPASQAEQEAGTVAVAYVAPATQQYHPSAAKGWAKFTGNSTTILAQENVDSLTDGTNATTANWTIGFSSVHYAAFGTAEETSSPTVVFGVIAYGGQASGAITFNWSGLVGYGDPTSGHIVAFGDQ